LTIAPMERALELARQAQGSTSPNPPVGAVIVKDGHVVGEGGTQPAGGPHAEIVALRQAGSLTHGATIYVTLEPCSHWGRTPPCADALIEAGIAAAHVALLDPNPLVQGRGVRRLRDHGVSVELGEGADTAADLIEAHTLYVTEHRPLVTLLLDLPDEVEERERQNADMAVSSLPSDAGDPVRYVAALGADEVAAIVAPFTSEAGAAFLRAGLVDRIVADPNAPRPLSFAVHRSASEPAPHVVLKRMRGG
jgi:pyrimidine deaminase RibD-like protein